MDSVIESKLFLLEQVAEFSNEKWQQIKLLAARLQAIKTMLEIFNEQIENRPFAHEFNTIKEQLETDFEQTLSALLALIENGDD